MLHVQMKNNYDFRWVGLWQSTEDYSEQEKKEIEALLEPKGVYPIFMRVDQLVLYYSFYENVMKTLFHNFKSLYVDMTSIENTKMWKEYTTVN